MTTFWIAVIISGIACVDLCDYRVFNWNFYLNHNKDLLRRKYRDEKYACKHWKDTGAAEGRQAHPTFHSLQYCELYEDLRKAGLCRSGHYHAAIEHYLDNGIREKRHGYNPEGAHGMWVLKNDILTLTASQGHAGAISSLIYKDKVEIVNSFDHGRQLQYAFTDSTGECNNPTEAGSGNDGIKDTTTSVLLALRLIPGQNIATTTQPAYWKGPEDPCTKGRGKLSPFKVAKQVTINFKGNPHLICYDISYTMALSYDYRRIPRYPYASGVR